MALEQHVQVAGAATGGARDLLDAEAPVAIGADIGEGARELARTGRLRGAGARGQCREQQCAPATVACGAVAQLAAEKAHEVLQARIIGEKRAALGVVRQARQLVVGLVRHPVQDHETVGTGRLTAVVAAGADQRGLAARDLAALAGDFHLQHARDRQHDLVMGVAVAERLLRVGAQREFEGLRHLVSPFPISAGRPARRRHLEAAVLEGRRHDAGHQRPVAQAMRRLPASRGHDNLRPLAGGDGRPEAVGAI
jgi:hypothetical protein